jgi:DNA mismatch repair protein MSH6
VIGKKLQVYWPLDKRWYAGCIKSYNAKLGKHVVEYEDGEEESLVLDDEKVIWLSGDDDESRGVGNGSGFRLSGKGQRRRQSQEPKDDGGEGGKKGAGQLKGCRPSLRKTRGQVTYDDDKGTDDEEGASDDDDDDDEDDVDFQKETEESDDDEEDNDSASDEDTDGENSDEDDEDLAALKKPKRLAKQTTTPPSKRKRRLIKKSGAALSTIAGGTVDVQGKSETPANGATKLSQRELKPGGCKTSKLHPASILHEQ